MRIRVQTYFAAALLLVAVALGVLVTPGAAVAQVVGNGSFLANGLTNTAVTVNGVGPRNLAWISCSNPSGAVAFVQVFDAATATVITPGTTVPKISMPFAAGSSGYYGIDNFFVNGIKIIASTTVKGGVAPGTALDCSLGYQ